MKLEPKENKKGPQCILVPAYYLFEPGKCNLSKNQKIGPQYILLSIASMKFYPLCHRVCIVKKAYCDLINQGAHVDVWLIIKSSGTCNKYCYGRDATLTIGK